MNGFPIGRAHEGERPAAPECGETVQALFVLPLRQEEDVEGEERR